MAGLEGAGLEGARLVEAKTPPDMDQRVEALERKVDGIAEDVAAIADAVADD